MTHTYKIEGMTCNGCKTSVENYLSAVENVTNTTINLDNGEAIIKMSTHISTEVFKNVLPKKYVITEKQKATSLENSTPVSEFEKTKLQQLKPLLIILSYISVATVLLNYKQNTWNVAMLDFMGLFFIVFSFFKILDLKGFTKSFKMYDPLAKVVPVYGNIYPFIETALGLLFLMRFQIELALIITLLILGITTVGVTKTLLDKKSIQCACLGTALKLPMTEATFIENAIMIIMAIFMLFNLS